MKRSDPTIHIRVPAEVRAWLEEQCAYYGSSHASEVVRALRERMERKVQQKREQAAAGGER